MWVRGLKLTDLTLDVSNRLVAPYVGAWIETYNQISKIMHYFVAPYVGAWIETLSHPYLFAFAASHPMWVRGLKLFFANVSGIRCTSHPMWVRGLKQDSDINHHRTYQSRTLCGCVD